VSARVLVGEVGLSLAVELLRKGDIVALPTETVYGLAGDAFQPMAVARIFEAKGRPLTDPLIVHLPEVQWLGRVACFDSPDQKDLAEELAAAFWPGPLTLLLKKVADLPDLVTAGSEFVAVRVTSHPFFQKVLRHLDSPIAAPSANRFGCISPTSAQDVLFELGDKIAMILDGGSCLHGLESTIVNLSDQKIRILRPGPITGDQLSKYGQVSVATEKVNTPGGLPGHYAPKKELRIIKTDINSVHPKQTIGLLAFTPPDQKVAEGFGSVEVLSITGDLREAASNFYHALRSLDNSKVDIIYAESFPEQGIGVAIMDRLRRAEHGSLNNAPQATIA